MKKRKRQFVIFSAHLRGQETSAAHTVDIISEKKTGKDALQIE